ncbi:DNA polymerase domain-containing protein [Tengunoibacter tsumagoiensis]|uniref:DNA-directed DNA polymerase n=1 Tax=Tengunoibacter tsumagoiensis TaxID=2014871 RepID=A0A401ZXE4_9CHLR|nr:DNA polymerase domain-containing protein [Tengunoibacter tsumagoiensis]GCE11505.1 DNA polymerase [Tengunoibacter tsumagoiensis]
MARSKVQVASALQREDEYLFGWDPMPGIVSVWAQRDGQAVIWQRINGRIVNHTEQYRPWVLATSLRDLAHLGDALQPVNERKPGKVLVRYHKLKGPEKSYSYLVFARDLPTLEQAILNGAITRLKKPLNSLMEIGDDYYRVGVVEQYLMGTGRVYFRGMNYQDLHRLQFDLETTALDPHRGRIFMVAIRDNQGFELVLDAPEPDDEAVLISRLCSIIQERDPDIIENHNLFGFDLPFLEHRAMAHGISLEIGRRGGSMVLESYPETLAVGPDARKRTRYSVAGRELIDTLDAVRRHDYVVRDMPSYGLKDVARYFGIASPERVYIEGAEIFETYRSQPALVRQYALDDVTEVDGLSRRLLGAPFALAGMAPRRYERLASAGPAMGILEPILVRSYLRAGAALPYQAAKQSAEDGLHEGGAVHLFAEGVAEHVVKADVASLYPSLMRTFQIGPACDRLGVLLSILGRLTDLRLTHKAAAQTISDLSGEANPHIATQAAMKILINAAYGYMGAGSMALFADGQAAGEVTRRGRTILTQVLDSLRQRGMALIEADTDGVYFAVPPDWTVEQERKLVSEIGAQLPVGIRLEYEGRYRAMLSHEVKNYALLTYDGGLIVHGVALRSSRAEPFGERFLRKALKCALLGDIQGVADAYQETVQMLRQRQFTASDLATRVRLSKTPEAYRLTRATHQEQAYEALLNAGRTHWYPGERIRFYKARNKTVVWLPDETEEAPVSDDWRERVRTGRSSQTPTNLPQHAEVAKRRDYDVEHYLHVLVTSYAARLRKAFEPADFEQLFRIDAQPGLFDEPIENIQPRWIRCSQDL